MAVTLELTDRGQSAPLSTLKSTLAWLGVSSGGNTAGTTAACYEFDSPGDVLANVGYGPGPEGIAAGIRVSETRQVFCRVNGSIAGTNSAVTKTGSGPSITLAGVPRDSYTGKIKVTKGGANGTATAQIALDGGTYGPTIDVPAEVNASVVGTASLSGFNYSSLDTLTLIVTPTNGAQGTVNFTGTTASNLLTQINAVIGPPKAYGATDLSGFTYAGLDGLTVIVTTAAGTTLTCTFASTTSGNFLTQLNTAFSTNATASLVGNHLVIAGSAGLTITVGAGTANTALGLTAGVNYGAQASLVQDRYIKITDGKTGSTSTLTVGAGTANAALGLTAGATTGAAATYAIPYTGLTLTFPVGTYVLGEVYSWTSTEPRFTVADLSAAITALQESQLYFRDIVVLTNPIDGADTRAFVNQLAISLSTMRGAEPRVFALAMVNSSIGSTSAIATNDADVKAAMAAQTDDYVCCVHGDCYMQGTAVAGTFRRPGVYTLGIRAAAYQLSSDPGNREFPQLEETSMVAPDLVTRARDETTATIKMRDQGFTTLKSVLGAPYFVQGRTRATSATFRYLGVMRTAVELARVLYEAVGRYENANRFASPDGTLRVADASAIKGAVEAAIDDRLENDISGRAVTVDTTTKVTVTNTLNIAVDAQHLVYFFTVAVKAGIVSILSSSSTAAA